jgi:hypothetical protein
MVYTPTVFLAGWLTSSFHTGILVFLESAAASASILLRCVGGVQLDVLCTTCAQHKRDVQLPPEDTCVNVAKK